MTIEQRRRRRKMRRAETRKQAKRAFNAFMSVIDLQASFNQTPTCSLAALCRAGRKIGKLAKDAGIHLDKRHRKVVEQKVKENGNS